MNNVPCKVCNEIVDLDSDDLSESAAFNEVHGECLSAYYDYLECLEESKRTGKKEFTYPTEEMALLMSIFGEDTSLVKRRKKAFQRIMNGDVYFRFKRIY